MLIAIDGPAGAGKSTVARELARELGFTYLDSGALYRSVALRSLRHPGVGAGRIAREASIELAGGSHAEAGTGGSDAEAGTSDAEAGTGGSDADGGAGGPRGSGGELPRVILDGQDVSDAIRAPEVSAAASVLAADPDVRSALLEKQRALLSCGDWVAEGRDIGTVVAPRAELKVFLTADPHVRAHRRARELGAEPAAVLAEQTLRDERDRTREHAPLQQAPDAIELDTTALTVTEAVRRIAELARAAQRST